MTNTNTNRLYTRVLEDVKENYDTREEQINYLKDIVNPEENGCESGIVPHLVYTNEIHQFFDEYYDEIKEIHDSLGEDSLTFNKNNHDMKTFLTWLAYEETARRVLNDLEQEES